MRTATLYNFLVEANLIAGIAILLLTLVRRLLRKQFGNRALYFAWLLVAVRLLCPLALPNPAINEIRPGHLDDQAIRPIAGQVKVRFTDASFSLVNNILLNQGRSDQLTQTLGDFANSTNNGTLPYQMMIIYFCGAGVVLCWFVLSNVRFRRKMKAGRIEQISGKLLEQYQELCARLKMKPIPVYYTDPLPSACLVGMFRPYIALPLTAAPREAIQVLTHEVFHYKGKDHILSLLRLLCCALHWFNPLTWLAANMSRTDAELSCDDRVVEKLDQEEKLAYTNALVLASLKRDAPGVGVLATGMTMTGKKLKDRVNAILYGSRAKKGLAISFTTLACVLLVAAFATAEYTERPSMPVIAQSQSTVQADQDIADDAQAIAYAQAFIKSDLLNFDTPDAQWTSHYLSGAYQVQALSPAMEILVDVGFLPNGMILWFNLSNNWAEASDEKSFYSSDTGMQDEVGKYIISFVQAALPGVEKTIDGLRYKGELSYNEKHFMVFHAGESYNGPVYQFVVQVLPEVRISYFNTEWNMLKKFHAQDDTTAKDANASGTSVMIGGFSGMDKADVSSLYTVPLSGDIALESALDTALAAIYAAYGDTTQSMKRFRLTYGFKTAPDAYFQAPYWQFDFVNDADPLDSYEVIIHSPDGRLLYICGPDKANG